MSESDSFPAHELDDLLWRTAPDTSPCDPEVANRLVERTIEKWRALSPATSSHRPQWPTMRSIRNRLFRLAPVALAASVLIALLALYFWDPTGSKALASGWHSTEGQSRSQLKAAFPNYQALQSAPQALPVGAKPDSEVDQIPTPSLEGFKVRSDSKFFDMTWWRRIASDQVQAGRISPVVFTRVIELRRIPGNQANRELNFKFWTSGFAVDPVKIKSTDTIIKARKPEGLHQGGEPMRTFLLTTDVTDHAEGEFFTVVVHAVYWNGSNHDAGEDVATSLTSDGISADLGVLLPPEHSLISGWALHKITREGVRSPENRLKAGQPPRDEAGMLYWPIAKTEKGYKYMLAWEWIKKEENR